jgi:DUF1009 family protein
MDKLGLIAGGGALPLAVATYCREAGRPLFVIRLKSFADKEMQAFDGVDLGLAELGKCIAALKRQQCAAVCMTGIVSRPDFKALKPDLRGLAAMPGVIAAARQGDDGLLRHLLGIFEKEGFRVEGATEVMGALLLGDGALGAVSPTPDQLSDALKAMAVASALGEFDVGQGAVVCDGLVLAVEAQEGTDAMLRRVAALPTEIRGTPAARRGALGKTPKPIQERRMDLPTMGVRTLEAAAAAGLAGVAGEAGAMVVVDREATIEAADRLGLFVWGAPPAVPPKPQ